jgi:hypothetical protein
VKYMPRDLTEEDLRLLEARRSLLAARAEAILANRRLRQCEKQLAECREALRGAEILGLEELAVARMRIAELEDVTDTIFASRRWRLWNALRYPAR